jgi:hypothetical protein
MHAISGVGRTEFLFVGSEFAEQPRPSSGDSFSIDENMFSHCETASRRFGTHDLGKVSVLFYFLMP